MATRLGAVHEAELTRAMGGIGPADVGSRDVRLRRAAIRALARLRAPGAREPLLVALRDEDDEVVAWAAYGLGDACEGNRSEIVRALGATLARLSPMVQGATPARLEPRAAIVRAVGRCSDALSEALLVEWARARTELMEPAIFALGDVANQTKRLREETIVALLEIAAGTASAAPVGLALYPLGRVAHLPPSVIEHTREVAMARLAEGGAANAGAANAGAALAGAANAGAALAGSANAGSAHGGAAFAARALGRTDDRAIVPLSKVLARSDAPAALRVEAARSLARLGSEGQRALRASVRALVPNVSDAVQATSLVGVDFAVALTVLESLTSLGDARGAIDRFAKLAAPSEAPASVVRRISWLRCTAAGLIAERDFDDAQLVRCDLATPPASEGEVARGGSIGARAIVRAIGTDGTQIRGKRAKAWAKWAFGADLRAREAALGLISEHHEIEEAARALTEALGSPHAGLVAAAAEVIAKHPERRRLGLGKNVAPADDALATALEGKGGSSDHEALSAVIDAVGAVKLERARPKLLEYCRSPHAVLRQHSEKALTQLGVAAPACRSSDHALSVPTELSRLVAAPVKVVFTTDAGALTLALEPALAPIAVTRFVELAKAGFFDGLVVHRVVPGFVTQLGSPTSDGYGGADGRAALPCETSPIHFAARSVGVALSGRDTGGSQFFVTHARTPHLDGQYAWLGEAQGPWDALVDGDLVTKAEVMP
ncbi:MAG: peptidylprolyl isomerase [Myxococcales bacterium]|nr:peptidylprolyl isomerase [Myxococcales bacterium]